MSIKNAQVKLQKAFDRLEAAARRLKDRPMAEGDAAVDALRAECDGLNAALAKARADHTTLQRLNVTASSRIDAVATRLKAVLEN